MRAWRVGLAAALLTVTGAVAADIPRPDDVEIDDGGNVWAVTHADYNVVQRLDGEVWTAVPMVFPGSVKAMAAGLARFHDGAVACVWRLSGAQMAVSRHSREESRILWQGEGEVPPGGLDVEPFGDSQNRLWITDSGPRIQWVDGKGDTRLVCDLADVEMRRVHRFSNPVSAAEDGLGRVWIWTNSLSGEKEYSTIAGILISDGEKVEQKILFGSADKDLGPIVRKDSGHMWVAVLGEGLYEVNIKTLAAQRLADPAANEFQNVERLFSCGNDIFLITARGRLWRWSGGAWTSVIDEVDRRLDKNRKWLADGGSVFLCGENIAWFFRRDAKAVPLDWRNQFPLEGVKNFLRLPDGRFFALGSRGKFFCGEINPKRPPSRAGQLEVRMGCSLDASSHVWCVEGPDKNILKMWGGKNWIKHPFPAGFSEKQFQFILPDEQGRIWLFPRSGEEAVILLEGATGKWRTFADREKAFEAVVSNPPRFVERARWPWSEGAFRPLYSGNLILYQAADGVVKFFDGEVWRSWGVREIQRSSYVKREAARLFFDAKSPGVEIDGQCWIWKDDVWTELGEPVRMDEGGSQKSPPLQFPDEVVSDTGNIVRDNHGAYWFLSKRALHKAVPGARTAIFSKNEPTPFLAGRLLQEVVVDSGGFAFLDTTSAWVLLHPLSPPPRIHVKVSAEGEGKHSITFDDGSLQGSKIRWQLDEGPWQPISGRRIIMEGLPNGGHIVRAQSLSEDLLFSTVATAKFETKIDREKQIASLIARLRDPDFAKRESAVKALLRQPEAALPILRSSREKAPASHRWWIEATLQEIQREADRGEKWQLQGRSQP